MINDPGLSIYMTISAEIAYVIFVNTYASSGSNSANKLSINRAS